MTTIGVIPAGGRGTRLGGRFTKATLPVPIGSGFEPVILRQIRALERICDQIAIVATPRKLQVIMDALGDMSTSVAYIAAETQTAVDAVRLATQRLKHTHVALAFSDTWVEPEDVFERLQESSTQVTLGCFLTSQPEKLGMVEVVNNRVISIVDKPVRTTLTDAWGVALWDNHFSQNYLFGENLSEAFQHAVEDGVQVGVRFFDNGRYVDIGTPDEYGDLLLQEISRSRMGT